VFTVKYRQDDTVDRYKSRLVVRGFTQTYRVDYLETLSPVAHLNFICVLFSLVVNQVNQQWLMVQLDVKNIFFCIVTLRRKFI